MQQQSKKVSLSFSQKKLQQKKQYFLDGNYEESCKSYEKHRKDLDRHQQSEYYEIIACSFLMVEKYKNAKKNIERAIELQPNLIELYITKAAIDYYLQLAFYEVYPYQPYQGDKVQNILKWLQEKSTNPAIFYIKMNSQWDRLVKQSLKQKITMYQHINSNYKTWKGAVPSWLMQKSTKSDYIYSCQEEIIDYFQTFSQSFTFAECQSFLDKLSCLIELRENQVMRHGVLIKKNNIGLISIIIKILNINDLVAREGWDNNSEIEMFEFINQMKKLWLKGERVFDYELFPKKLIHKNFYERNNEVLQQGGQNNQKQGQGQQNRQKQTDIKEIEDIKTKKAGETKRMVYQQPKQNHENDQKMTQQLKKQGLSNKNVQIEKLCQVMKQLPLNNSNEQNKNLAGNQQEKNRRGLEKQGIDKAQVHEIPLLIKTGNQIQKQINSFLNKQNEDFNHKGQFQIVSTKYEVFLQNKLSQNLYFIQQAYISNHIDVNFAAQNKKSVIFVCPKFIRNITPRKTIKLLQKINKEAARLLFHSYMALCFLILQMTRQGFQIDKIKQIKKLFEYVYNQIEASSQIKYSKQQVKKIVDNCDQFLAKFNRKLLEKVPQIVDRRVITNNIRKLTFCIHVIDDIFAKEISERLKISENQRKVKQVVIREDKEKEELIIQLLIQVVSGFIKSRLIQRTLKQKLKSGLQKLVWQKPSIFSRILNKIFPFINRKSPK